MKRKTPEEDAHKDMIRMMEIEREMVVVHEYMQYSSDKAHKLKAEADEIMKRIEARRDENRRSHS